MYTCGPSVYDFAHIGNFRTYVFEDLLKRTLKYFGFEVVHVMNITDVEDKVIRRCIESKMPLEKLTERYTLAFFEDSDRLHIQKADHYPRATAYIPQMITFIEKLIASEHAYVTEDGDVFFRIRSFEGYGKLSHFILDELKEGASERVSRDEYEKENAKDFVLWKSYDAEKDGPIFWSSPWGKGRPGWHIECSTMATELLGETIDIHVGGVDNMFPHHENEIAQSESLSCKVFARIWMHAEHLIVDGRKMSKSLGNFYTVRDLLLQGFSGEEIRFALLANHYRTRCNFTLDTLQAARSSMTRLYDFIDRLETYTGEGKVELDVKEAFDRSLADDLNINAALAALFDFVREVNILMDQKALSQKGKRLGLDFLKTADRVLGFLFTKVLDEVPGSLLDLLRERERARHDKNYPEADRLRDEIMHAGYTIEDSPTGPKLKKKTGQR